MGTPRRLAIAYIGYALLFTQLPFDHSLDALQEWGDWSLAIRGVDVWVNVLMMMPLGFLLALPERHREGSLAALPILFISAGISIGLEGLQLFLPSRTASLMDVMTNVVGAGLGIAAARIWMLMPLRSLVHNPHWLVPAIAAISYIFIAKAGIQARNPNMSLEPWENTYPLIFANEATGDRPWLGEIHLAAIYNRAVTSSEVKLSYQLGPHRQLGGDPGIVQAFTFADIATGDLTRPQNSGELELWSADEHSIRILRPRGVEVLHPTRIISTRPASQLVEAIRASSAFTVEVWIQPQSLQQRGPARIISISHDPGLRNLTLGQIGANLEFRLRTRETGPNGGPQRLRTQTGPLTGSLQHVMVTYDRGVERLYIDGKQVGSMILAVPTLGALRSAGIIGVLSFAWILGAPLGVAGSLLRSVKIAGERLRLALAFFLPYGMTAVLVAVNELWSLEDSPLPGIPFLEMAFVFMCAGITWMAMGTARRR